MKDHIRKFLLSNWTRSEKSLLAADILLFGVLIGWITSPFRDRTRSLAGIVNSTNGCEDREEELSEETESQEL